MAPTFLFSGVYQVRYFEENIQISHIVLLGSVFKAFPHRTELRERCGVGRGFSVGPPLSRAFAYFLHLGHLYSIDDQIPGLWLLFAILSL